jgi:hypothetical protein
MALLRPIGGPLGRYNDLPFCWWLPSVPLADRSCMTLRAEVEIYFNGSARSFSALRRPRSRCPRKDACEGGEFRSQTVRLREAACAFPKATPDHRRGRRSPPSRLVRCHSLELGVTTKAKVSLAYRGYMRNDLLSINRGGSLNGTTIFHLEASKGN